MKRFPFESVWPTIFERRERNIIDDFFFTESDYEIEGKEKWDISIYGTKHGDRIDFIM